MAAILDQARRKSVAAAVLGGVLEWYDFAVYAFMAPYIARTFFPSHDPYVSLLTTLAVFGVGFLARPVGAFVIGRVGDTRGRRASLILSIVMMTVGTVLIGILPGYDAIGIVAPILVVVARLLQGFSIGGEWGNAVAFLVEWAPKNRRGLYGSLNTCIASTGLPLGSGVAAIVVTALPASELAQWGWRIPFLLTAILGPIGYYVRRGATESPAFVQAKKIESGGHAKPTADFIFSRAWKAFCVTIAFTVGTYIFLVFMPTLVVKYTHIGSSTALWSNTASGLIAIALVPLFGYLSDRVGRKPQLLLCSLGFIVLPYPMLGILLNDPTPSTVFLVQLILDLVLAAYGAAVPALLAELFPVRMRTTWMSTTFALAVAIFGGFAGFIATWLIQQTGQPIAPAFYVIAAGAVSGIALMALKGSEMNAVPDLVVAQA